MRRLRLTARTLGCARGPAATLLASSAQGSRSFASASPAVGGVRGASYTSSPYLKPPARPRPSGSGLLGAELPTASDAVLAIVLTLMVGLLTIALLFADALGVGPRHRRWRDTFNERRRGRWP